MRFSIWYVIFGVCAVMSVVSVIFGLIRGSGTPRKKLLHSVLLLGAVALLCFGGDLVLSWLGMGWRCTPRNTMLFLCGVLIAVTSWRCMHALSTFDSGRPVFQVCGGLSLGLVMIVSIFGTLLYFSVDGWYDWLEPYDGQTIVRASDAHGGSGAHRYYAHVNALVHGEDLHIDLMEWYHYQSHGVPLPISDPPLPRVTVKLDSETEDYATICAVDREDGTTLWEYTTDRVEGTAWRAIWGIGLIGDRYFFVCGGSVICLDARTGQERWRNDDFGGVEPSFAVGDGIIYLCGIDGPDLFAITTEGETVKRIDTLYSGYHSPCYLELSGNTLTVTMFDGSGDDPGTQRYVRVDLSDWSATPIDYE